MEKEKKKKKKNWLQSIQHNAHLGDRETDGVAEKDRVDVGLGDTEALAVRLEVTDADGVNEGVLVREAVDVGVRDGDGGTVS